MKTYEISKGQQYDSDGAVVFHGSLCSRYDADGSFDGGDLISLDHETEVEAAVRRVIVSGQPETITLGQPPITSPISENTLRGRCPHYTPDDGCPLHGEYCAPEED